MSEISDLYFGGLPTAPDVRTWLDRWPIETLVPGKVLRPAELAAAIGVQPGQNRYRTVESAFRKMLRRDHNIEFRKQHGELTIMGPDDRILYAGGRQESGVRIIKRSGKMIYRTDTSKCSPEMKKIAEHRVRLAATVSAAERTAPKQLKAPDLDAAHK